MPTRWPQRRQRRRGGQQLLRRSPSLIASTSSSLTRAPTASSSKDVYVDWEDIAAWSEDWQTDLFTAIERAETFVLVLSPESAASPNVDIELTHALQQNPAVRQRRDDRARLRTAMPLSDYLSESVRDLLGLADLAEERMGYGSPPGRPPSAIVGRPSSS